jgi:GNAT superfamily N-acetyltransferase
VKPSLAELAEDTIVHLLPRPGFELVDRGDLVFEAGTHHASVQRLRLGDVDVAVDWARRECARRRLERCEWWVGWSATPADLPQRLLELGLLPDDEESTLTGMSCDHPPPAAPHVEVQRIESLAEQLVALEVDWDVWALPEAARVSRRAHEQERFDPNGPVHHFAAYADGRPVGFGRAIDMDDGVALMGGAVLAEFRGRGVYRALVHARWQHAAARDTPLLVVQAGHMSEPVLAGLGFVPHGRLHLFMDPRVASSHGDDRNEQHSNGQRAG